MTFEQKDGKIIASRMLKLNKEIIPEEEYIRFKEVLAEITKAEKSSIVFETKS